MSYDEKNYGQSPFGNAPTAEPTTVQTTATTIPDSEPDHIDIPEPVSNNEHDRSTNKTKESRARTVKERSVNNSKSDHTPNPKPKRKLRLSEAFSRNSSDGKPESDTIPIPDASTAIKIDAPKLSLLTQPRGITGWTIGGELVGWSIHWLAIGFVRSLLPETFDRFFNILISSWSLAGSIVIYGFVISRHLLYLSGYLRAAQQLANRALELNTKSVDNEFNINENANDALRASRDALEVITKRIVTFSAFLATYAVVSLLY